MAEEQYFQRLGPAPRGRTEPPPPPHPRAAPEWHTYIPEREGNPPHCPPGIQPPSFPPMTPDVSQRASGPPPTTLDRVNLLVPPPHIRFPPSSMFLRPPPPAGSHPPSFTQPPPPMPPAQNIPHQFKAASPSSCMQIPQDGSSPWPQVAFPQPAVSQHPQEALREGPSPLSTHPRSTEHLVFEEDTELSGHEELQWLSGLERKVSARPQPPQPQQPTGRKALKLVEVQKAIQEAHTLREHLGHLEEQLTQVRDTADDQEWSHLVQQAEKVKVSLCEVLQTLRDEAFICRARTLLRQRRAKRRRVRARGRGRRLEREELRKGRHEEEERIDAWREKLQQGEEAKRRENAVKREADSILGEVHQKQVEGQRMLQLLEALAALRQARANSAAAQGQPPETQAAQQFSSTSELLSGMVKKQLREYELEEQTLRVMMEESASHNPNTARSGKGDGSSSRYEDTVKKLLFGSPAPEDVPATLSLEALVQRRQEWDQFVIEKDSPLASPVPLPWVIPSAWPASPWAKYLAH